MNSKCHFIISYDKSDTESVEDVVRIISLVQKKDNSISYFHRGMIYIGENITETYGKNLQNADVVLMLISSNYIGSDEFDIIQKHKKENENCLLIPIILRKCCWKYVDAISEIQATPRNGKCLNDFKDIDSFWSEVQSDLIKLSTKRNSNQNNIFKLGLNAQVANNAVRAGKQGSEYSPENARKYSSFIEVKDISANATMFPIKGDSMTGVLEDGEHVICEQLYGEDNSFVNGHKEVLSEMKERMEFWKAGNQNKKYMCVIETFHDGFYVKHIKEINFEKEIIILESYNPIYPDLTFNFSQLKAIWQVKKVQSIRDID